MIQKHSTSKFATKFKFKIYKPNKNSQFFLCVSTNTDINKLNWRFNHIFLVITNRDFYCMLWYTNIVVQTILAKQINNIHLGILTQQYFVLVPSFLENGRRVIVLFPLFSQDPPRLPIWPIMTPDQGVPYYRPIHRAGDFSI